jgi:hypothetical protein
LLGPLLGDGSNTLLEGERADSAIVLLDELLPLAEGSGLLGGDLGALADGGILGLLRGGELVPSSGDDLGLLAEVLGGLDLRELPGLLCKDVEASEGASEGDGVAAEHFFFFFL